MSTAGRTDALAPPASDLAAALADAGFVRLVASADGDAAAATGLLAGGLEAAGTPFQASLLHPCEREIGATRADYTVAIGDLDVAADAVVSNEVATSATAFEVAGELAAGVDDGARTTSDDAGTGPDPVLALAGTIAAGEVVPPVVEATETAGVERRPGIAVPVADFADGLAHSTLVHAPFSGDVDAVTAALDEHDLPPESGEDTDEDDRRRLASLVALETSSAADESEAPTPATERAAEAVERALHPAVGGPFETVGGFADVLDATARERPGAALSLALGHESVRSDALDAWREHGAAAHAALADGEQVRYDGLFVVRETAMPVATVARLAADFRSPEPVVLAVANGEAAIHAVAEIDAAAALRSAAETVDDVDAVEARATGAGQRGRARFATEEEATPKDASDETVPEHWTEIGDELVAAVREAL